MDKVLAEKAKTWVKENRTAIVEGIKRLVAIESVSQAGQGGYPFGEGVQKALEEALAIGKENGFNVFDFDHYIGKIALNEVEGAKEVGFWAHLDVVPAGDFWINKPYEPVEQEGYLIGRGVSDNKSPAIGILYAALCLKALGVDLSYNLSLYLGTSEETGMQDVEYFTKNFKCPDLSIIPDSSFPVCRGEKGVLTVEITSDEALDSVVELAGGHAHNIVPNKSHIRFSDGTEIHATGIGKHSASPEGSLNAINELIKQALESGKLSEHDAKILTFAKKATDDFYGQQLNIASGDELCGKLTCVGTILTFEGGKVKLSLNIRCPIMVNADRVVDMIKSVARQNGYTGHAASVSYPYYFPGDLNIVDKLTEIYNGVRGTNEKPFFLSGGTYASHLPNALGFGSGFASPKPAFLPENHGGAHQPDEILNIDDFLEAVAIYAVTMAELNNLIK